MYLLDTNVLSAMKRPEKAGSQFVKWATAAVPEQLYVSALTLFEIKFGALRISRRDPVQGQDLERWIQTFVLKEFMDRTLDITVQISMRCAALHVPDPRPIVDSLIAATALEHGLTVVTRNVADFRPMGVALLDPWQI